LATYDTNAAPIVRERYWIRSSPASPHLRQLPRINEHDQTGIQGPPTNEPQALRTLLRFWLASNPSARPNSAPRIIQFRKWRWPYDPGQSHRRQHWTAHRDFHTANGTALAGTDYVATNGVLTWLDGDATGKSLMVPIFNDGLARATRP